MFLITGINGIPFFKILLIGITFALVFIPNWYSIKPTQLVIDAILVILIVHLPLLFFLLSAALTPAWQGAAIWGLFKTTSLKKISYLYASASQIPFWVYSVIEAKRSYLSLPSQPPQDCFVATASAQGYPRIIGPTKTIFKNNKFPRSKLTGY